MIAVQTFEQDTNVYEFPDECVVMPDFDKKPFFTKLSGAQAIQITPEILRKLVEGLR